VKGLIVNMSFSKKTARPSRYIIRVKGRLDSEMEHWFEGMTITPADNETTTLYGEVIDQSALHGLLETIHSLNLTLLSVQKLDI
jgi:hypothetical protein